ncbi:MAG: glycosyltransferase family 4 protein [Chloroflexota bacterium]
MAEVGLSGLLLDSPHSGTAVYTRNLLRHLPGAAPDLDFRLFVRNSDPLIASIPVDRLDTPWARLNHESSLFARLDKLHWETISFPLAARLRNVALVHSLYFAAPVVQPAPVVVTIHDLVPLVVPGYHRGRAPALYSQLMTWTARRAAAIITVSEHARQDIIRVLRIPESRVHITPEAVDERFTPDPGPEDCRVRSKYHLPERFVLYLGSAERRKNLETLVRAWATAESQMRGREVTLVIVSHFPPNDDLYPDVRLLAQSLGVSTIQFVPEVEEQDKPALYRLATLFCFPSTYEGFGLPPLEALASGLPLLCSSATSLPEVVGEAGRLLDPMDVQAWGDSMIALIDSQPERDELRRRGPLRAAHFHWSQTARQTAEVYRSVLAR